MSANKYSSVRIISGSKRGSKIHFESEPGLRPSGDRVRELLFSWLQTSVVGCTCLDMFAGSGALGFEASSRGAAMVCMLEMNRSVVTTLNENIDRLRFDNITVLAADALQAATYQLLPNNDSQFDLIFIDPPFADGLHQSAIELVQHQQLLRPGGFVYVETARRAGELIVPAAWELHREKIAGDVQVRLYRTIAAE